MPSRHSAGLLLFRRPPDGGVEVLLGHLGGPLWAAKDTAAWSAPKGEIKPGEEPFEAACREFTEELGLPVPDGEPFPLGDCRQSSGKVVTLWALPADLDVATVVPGTFTLQWPPRSGRYQEFPEIDRVAWFAPAHARDRLVAGQRPFLDRLLEALDAS
ncbi:MAG: NUDIX domain-containing protein [Angustibacter sp.]